MQKDFKKLAEEHIKKIKEHEDLSLVYIPFINNLILPIQSKMLQDKFITIYIDKELSNEMDYSDIDNKISKLVTSINLNYNTIEINKYIDILLQEYINDSECKREDLSKVSLKRILCRFNKNDYTILINGMLIDNNSVFISQKERESYSKLYDMDDFEKLLEEYKSYLDKPANYTKFFVSKVVQDNIQYKKKYSLAVNNTEELLRDDLHQYMNSKLKHTVNRENLLESRKRLDLTTEDDGGQTYFIEIKWMGNCIDKSHSKPSKTIYANAEIKNGVSQTLEYIKELINYDYIILGKGYLVVFDLSHNQKEYEFITDYPNYITSSRNDLIEYLDYFVITKPLRIENKKQYN
jgi:hypothetical protein